MIHLIVNFNIVVSIFDSKCFLEFLIKEMLCIREHEGRNKWVMGDLKSNDYQKKKDKDGNILKDDNGEDKNKFEKCGQVNLIK